MKKNLLARVLGLGAAFLLLLGFGTTTALAQGCGELAQEAEIGTIVGGSDSLTRLWDSAANNNQGVWAPPTRGRQMNLSQVVSAGNYVEFCATVPAAGDYFINARIKAETNESDSFYVEVLGSNGRLYGPAPWHTGFGGGYNTKRVRLADPVNSSTLSLPRGDVRLRFHHREAGVILDNFVLNPVLASVPTPTPPPTPTACTSPSVQAEDGAVSNSEIFRTGSDPAAQNGKFIGTRDLSGNYTTINSSVPYVDFCLRVDERLDYRVRARVRAANSNSDSFWVSVKGSDPKPVDTGSNGLEYFDTDFRKAGSSEPLTFFLGRGEVNVRVFPREDGARLDSISLVPIDPPQPACGDLSREAEFARPLGEPDGNIVRATDRAAAGSQYVGVPNGAGNSNFSSAQFLEYCIEVPESGRYRMKARVKAETTGDDSFWIQIDDTTQKLWHIGGAPGWRTVTVTDAAQRGIAEWYLTAGQHRLRIYQREDGTQLDNFELFRVGAADPVRILALGDSITNSRFYREELIPELEDKPCAIEWVGPRTTKSVHNAGLDGDHAGFPGATASEVADRARVLGSVFRPDIALIHLGTNDLKSPSVSVNGVVSEIERAVNELRVANPNITVLVAQVIPSRVTDHTTFANVLASRAPSWSTQSEVVLVVDLFSNFDTATLLKDNVHPNEFGGEEMALRWKAALDQVNVCAGAG